MEGIIHEAGVRLKDGRMGVAVCSSKFLSNTSLADIFSELVLLPESEDVSNDEHDVLGLAEVVEDMAGGQIVRRLDIKMM